MLTPQDREGVFQHLAERLGYPVSRAKRLFELDPFWYVINYLPATASAITSGQFTVQADSAFALVLQTFIVSSTVDAFVVNLSDTPRFAPALITQVDSGSGRELSDAAVAIENVYGTGQRPYRLAKPKLLDPNSTFTVRLQNLEAIDRRYRLAHHGYKIFGNIKAFVATHGR